VENSREDAHRVQVEHAGDRAVAWTFVRWTSRLYSQQLWVQCDRKEDVDPIRTRRDPPTKKLTRFETNRWFDQPGNHYQQERPEDADLTSRDPSGLVSSTWVSSQVPV
jgi:hypothetical protein